MLGSRWGSGGRSVVGVGGWSAVVFASLAAVVVLVLPSAASAEPLCTDTWTGGLTGNWATGANWSTASPPTSSDVACIGAGVTVEVSGGVAHAAVLEDKGTLDQTGGAFELTSSLEPSTATSYAMTSGTLTGPATLNVTGTLTWGGGTMSGTGTTALKSGASGTVEGTLSERSLVNEGTMTLGSPQLYLQKGAHLTNSATFIANNELAEGLGSETSTVSFTNTNTGKVRKTSGAGRTTLEVPFANEGIVEATTGTIRFRAGGTGTSTATWSASPGARIVFGKSLSGPGAYKQVESTWKGAIEIGEEAAVTTDGVNAANASVEFGSGQTWTIPSGTVVVSSFKMGTGTLTGAGTLTVSGVLTWTGGKMTGGGKTVVQAGGSGEVAGNLIERTLVNEGSVKVAEAELYLGPGAYVENLGTFTDNYEVSFGIGRGSKDESKGFRNLGVFRRTSVGVEKGAKEPGVEPAFYNYGVIEEGEPPYQGIEFAHLIQGGKNSWGCGTPDPSFPKRELAEQEGVCTASGDLAETQTDFAIGGRGIGLDVVRTYNSRAAAANLSGGFGYGWTSPYTTHLAFHSEILYPAEEEEPASEAHWVTLFQENGSVLEFREGAAESWIGPGTSPDILTGSEAKGFTLTLENQQVDKFSGSTGKLESITDRFGNTTTFAYNGSGRLETVTDPSKERHLTFAYNEAGLISSVEDPEKRVIKYGYTEGQLTSVSQPGEEAARWQFKYEAHHLLSEITDGRGNKTKISYTGSSPHEHWVSAKEDPLGHKWTYEYGPGYAITTNVATGAKTYEHVTSFGSPASIVRGYGTEHSSAETLSYDAKGNRLTRTDGNSHTWHYAYSEAGDQTQAEDPEGHKTKRAYDAKHNVETETLPGGETTTYERQADGNITEIERPTSGAPQVTKYKYNGYGLPETMTDPLARVTEYKYDIYGNKTAEIDPERNERTWGYNLDGYETSSVTPKGRANEHKEEAKYKTTTERNARQLPIKVTAPLKEETLYEYDGNGNRIKLTDPLKNITKYVYDADNELSETEEPNKATTKTEYDGAGQQIKQTDGNGHATRYKRNVLEQVEQVEDPLARKTSHVYDKGGNLIETVDPAKRTTTRTYNPDERLTETSYSDGKTPAVKYEYNGDGLRTKMTDGSGTTKYEYDQLDRLTETEDGAKHVVKYKYDLANQLEVLTYPNGKAISREYDKAGRLRAVEDWLKHRTTFGYDANSNQTSTTFPSGTTNEDTYAYDETDNMKEQKFLKGAETLASIAYTRNKNNQVTKAADTGLPGEPELKYEYDENSRIKKGTGNPYKYDSANNPTTIGKLSYTYDTASEIERAKEGTTTKATYAYDELGERTKQTPSTGPATTYGYNQAERLTEVNRPKEGETLEIKDTYTYNGDGLRTSQTVGGTTTYLAWQLDEQLPVVLSDGARTYIYGPNGLSVEQIGAEEHLTYLHHDQQGSTRLLTGATGTVEGAMTYDAYGSRLAATGTASTGLGYDGQLTDADTGLIYLRARYYDPSTAQFVSVDPLQEGTGETYGFANAAPLGYFDPSGACTEASAARAIDYKKPPPCFARLTGSISLFSLQTSGTPAVSWGIHILSRYLAQLVAMGYAPARAKFESYTTVNGVPIKGPGPKEVGVSYVYHGSIGPKIYGNTRLKRGDIVSLLVSFSGSAINARGQRIEFSGFARGLCEVR